MIKEKKIQAPQLKSIQGVEIFATGKHHGDVYTESDLDEMVRAFNETSGLFQPYLKIGHGDNQKLIENSELPAAGYVSNLKRFGQKLVADFVDIPEKVYFLMKHKAYKKRSSEIYWDISMAGKKFSRMLRAVALLGADVPEVSSLDDIISFYGLSSENVREYGQGNDNFKICNFDQNTNEVNKMTKELEKKVADLEKSASESIKTYAQKEKELKIKEDELAENAKKYAALEAKQKEIEVKAKSDEIKNFAKSLVSEKLATPAMEPLIAIVIGDELKEYSVSTTVKKDGDDEITTKKYSDKKEVLKEILKLHSAASTVNLEENSNDSGNEGNKGMDLDDAKITKYASENKVSYSDAYKEVMRNKTE